MRRLVPCLLLFAAPAAWSAALDDPQARGQTPCVYASPAGDAPAMPAKPATNAQGRPAKPAAAGGGSGGESDLPMPRARSTKWHSFLPGMFR